MYTFKKEPKGYSVYFNGQYVGTAYSAKSTNQALKIILEP